MRGASLSALLLWALAFSARADSGTVHDYVGAEKCKTCHSKELMGNQFAAWLDNPHHRAWETLRGEAARTVAAELGLEGAPQQAAACLRCHSTAYGIPPARIVDELDPADGVQCESCHGPGRDFRKKDIMSDRELAMQKGLWDAKRDASICTRCHNEESPTFDSSRYTSADGRSAGFLFDVAKRRIAHPIPADVKGHYVELEDQQRAEEEEEEGGWGLGF